MPSSTPRSARAPGGRRSTSRRRSSRPGAAAADARQGAQRRRAAAAGRRRRGDRARRRAPPWWSTIASTSPARPAVGVHVGQDDLPPEVARRLLGPAALVGCSTHTPAQSTPRWRRRSSYVAYGPVFATATKAAPDPVVGLDGLRAAARRTARGRRAAGGHRRHHAGDGAGGDRRRRDRGRGDRRSRRRRRAAGGACAALSRGAGRRRWIEFAGLRRSTPVPGRSEGTVEAEWIRTC